jgi:general secretion pathway protein G
MKRRRYSPALSLVEIIVAITIIAIISTLLFPLAAKIRKSSQATVALQDLRGIAAAINLYACENDGKLPPMSQTKYTGPFWTDYLLNYVDTPIPSGGVATTYTYLQSPTFISPLLDPSKHCRISDYGANRELFFQVGATSPYTKITAIPRPSSTVMFVTAESVELSIGAWYIDSSSYIGGHAQYAPSDQGSGKIHCVFVDGHVQSLTDEEFQKDARSLLFPNP